MCTQYSVQRRTAAKCPALRSLFLMCARSHTHVRMEFYEWHMFLVQNDMFYDGTPWLPLAGPSARLLERFWMHSILWLNSELRRQLLISLISIVADLRPRAQRFLAQPSELIWTFCRSFSNPSENVLQNDDDYWHKGPFTMIAVLSIIGNAAIRLQISVFRWEIKIGSHVQTRFNEPMDDFQKDTSTSSA